MAEARAVGAIRSTVRAVPALPSSTASIAVLTSSRVHSERSTRVLPRRCSAKTSSRSWWVPTIEPTTVSPPSTVSKIGSRMRFSAGRPTQTRRPPRASDTNTAGVARGGHVDEERSLALARVLHALNQLLAPRLKANHMNAALLFAVIDPHHRTMNVANAGMNHLLDDRIAPAGGANGRDDFRVPHRLLCHPH